jgi:tetratricopeptide (TPR) repeat protein
VFWPDWMRNWGRCSSGWDGTTRRSRCWSERWRPTGSVVIWRERGELPPGWGRALSQDGRTQEGLSQVEPLIDLLTWNGPSSALASLHLALGSIVQGLGRYEEMLGAAEQAAELAAAIDDGPLLARAMERRGTALNLLGRSDESRQVLAEAVPLLEQVGNLGGLLTALGNLGEAYRLRGNLLEARHATERALEVAERIGNLPFAAFVLMNLGEILLSLGQWEQVREQLVRAGEMLGVSSSASQAVPYVPAVLGQVLLAEGNWQEADLVLQGALDIAETREDRQALEMIQGTWGELDLLRGDPESAIMRLEPLLGREGGFQSLIEIMLAWALLEAGELPRAGDLISETVVQARARGEVLALVDALRVQGMVLAKQGQGETAEQVLEEGLALARQMPYPYAEARILEQLGRIDEALAIFQRLGAKKDIERLERASTT